MNQPVADSTELFSRFSRASMYSLLVVIILLGGTSLAIMLSPAGAVSRSIERASWLIPIAIVIFVAVQGSARGRRWGPDSPEVKAVMQDEWRRANMDRASRVALLVVLIAQWPLSLMLGFLTRLPTPRAAMAMATSTMTLGFATLIALFLYFDRE